MSREAFPQLPPDTLVHLESFPPELHTYTKEQLLALSHIALHREGDFENTPVPQTELGEAHQPHIDSVAHHMERTSLLFSSAHSELDKSGLDEHKVSFVHLAEKAKEIAIRSAIEAKRAGDTDAATKSLESLLVIESLEATASTDQTKRLKGIVRTIVAEGLATELVKATHETFGLVALQEHHAVPLNAIARSSPKLLRAATSLDFTDDFSEVETNEQKSDVSDLSCGDLLALAKMSETERPDTNVSREMITQALKNVPTEKVEPDDLVELLLKADELSLNDELSVTLSALRLRRRAGDSTYRINDPNTVLLDEVVVKLMQKGKTEVARGLISSSPKDPYCLKRAIEREVADEAEVSQLSSKLESLCQDKQTELRERIISTGASESIAKLIIQTTADPDSAANIPTEFWEKLTENYTLQETLTSGEDDLARTAKALIAIDSFGLIEHSQLLLQKVLRLGDGESTDSFLASFSEAFDHINSIIKEGQYVDLRMVLTNLANFEDPSAALKATKTLYGTENYLKELPSLYALVRSRYCYEEPATFRPEDISALGVLREYCAKTSIDYSLINSISKILLDADDPIGKARSITEGFRLAGVTADDKNVSLFFEIAKREDPVSLGRAVSVLKPLRLTDISDSIYQDILKLISSSQRPEETAQLIVRTQQALQNQNLTIEGIGIGKLSEAMHIVNNDEDTKAIERYCSNWKIQHECEEAFQKYLQPVRESGDRKTMDIAQRPKLADLPEIRARFEHLGIAPVLAESMLESWLSYSALSRLLYNDGKRNTVTGTDIDSTLAEQGEQLVKQAEALTNYVESFGIEETNALIDIFGIYNFIRYKPEQLHNQLLSWQSGELPARNIVVSARADWNGAVSDAGISFADVFGEDGLFCFEVNDRIELARVAVSIGNRERAMGRKPEEINALNNFIIDAHANSKGILLGTRGQHLDVTDYPGELKNGQRANTYRRHLGTKFRVILKACSTAGEVKYGKNIAETISGNHDVRVESSEVTTYGGIIIEPDGTVRFNGGEVLSTVYA